MTALTLVLIIIALLLLTFVGAVFSAAEAATRLLTRGRTRRLIEAERPGAAALDALVERPSRLAAAAALWRAVTYAAASPLLVFGAARVLSGEQPWWTLAVIGVIGVIGVFALAETLPRTLAVHNPERVGLQAAPAAAKLAAVFAPVARFLAGGWLRMAALVADEPVNDAWLTGDEYLPETADDAESGREGAEEAFLEAVVDFSSKIVREVMVPRTDMVCLEDTATIDEAVALVASSGCSRLPVYHETLDDIRGVLFAKDLLICVGADDCPPTVSALGRDAYFVPETKPVDELLVEMRQRKTHMALVADEYGGTAGLVTIEDLLEEIVGEIFDEYDRAEPMVTELDDGRLLLDARMPVDDFNDLLGTAIELEADSIGGLFVELAGHIPEPGETVEVEGVVITARDVEGTRVRRLVVQPTGDPDKETADAEESD